MDTQFLSDHSIVKSSENNFMSTAMTKGFITHVSLLEMTFNHEETVFASGKI